MMMTRMPRCVVWGWTLILLVCALGPVWAQPTPDETVLLQANTLFDQRQYLTAIPQYMQFLTKFPASKAGDQATVKLGRCYFEMKQWKDAIQTLDGFRQRYPASPLAPDVTVLLFRSLIAQPEMTRAKTVWDELFTKWPKTDYAWQAAEAYYQAKALTDSEQALTWLDGVAKQGVLPENAPLRVTQLRLRFLETTKPTQFLTEALPLITAGKDAKTPADLTVPQDLARRVYGPLMNAGRYEEAKNLSQGLQDALARLGNPANGLQADLTAYFAALERSNTTRFLAEALPLAKQIPAAATKGDAAWPADLARRLYTPLILADRLEEATALQDQVQVKLLTLGLNDAQATDRITYLTARMNYLERMRPAQFQAEALALITSTQATSAPAMQVPADVTRRLYLPLMSAGRLPEAGVIHERVSGDLVKLGNPSNWAVLDLTAYLAALERTNPAQFIKEATAVIAKSGEAKSLPELLLPADLARRLYGMMLPQGRIDETDNFHQQLQRALTTLGAVDYAQNDTIAFTTARLNALEKNNPAQFVTDALAVCGTQSTAKTPLDLTLPVTFAARVYAPLIAAGRVEDAKGLYGQLETTLVRFGNPNDGVRANRIAFYGALERGNPARFLTDATALLRAAETTTSPADLLFAISIAPQTFAALAQANRLEDLKALHTALQTACGKIAIAPESVQAEQNAFLTAYERYKPDLFLTEAQARLDTLATAKTQEEAKIPAELVRRVYVTFCTAGRLVDAQALNTQAQATLIKLSATDLVKADALAYRTARLSALERSNPAQFVQEATPVVATVKDAVTAADLVVPTDLAHRCYPILCQAGRLEEGKGLTDQIQAAATKWSTPDVVAAEALLYQTQRLAYLERLQPSQFLKEASTVLTATKCTNANWTTLVDLARRVYGPLYLAGRGAEADTLHGQLQTRLQALGLPDPVLTDKNNVQTARLAYWEKADLARFLTEGLAAIAATKEAQSPLALTVPLSLPGRLYVPLLKAGRFDDVKSAHGQVQAALVRFGNPGNGLTTELGAYYTALESANAPQFLPETQAFLATGIDGKTPAEITLRTDLARRVYAPLFSQNKLPEAEGLHQQLQRQLTSVNASDLAQTDTSNYLSARLAFLEKANAGQFLTEAQAPFAGLATAKTAADLAQPVALAPRVYPPLIAAGRVDDAKGVYQQLETALRKFGNPNDGIKANRTAFYGALERGNPVRFLMEATALLGSAPSMTAPADLLYALSLAPQTFTALAQTNRLEEMKTLHQTLQTACGKLTIPADSLQAELNAYLTAYERYKSDLFLAEAQTRLAALATAKTVDEATFPVELARRAYPILGTSGRLAEAQTLNTQVQSTLTKLGATELAKADTLAYRMARLSILERSNPAQFVQEATSIIIGVKEATSAADLAIPTDLAHRCYPILCQAGRLDDAKSLAEQLQTATAKWSTPEAAQAELQVYQTARLAYLERTIPTQFATEALANLAATTATTASAWASPLDLARRAYAPLYQTGRGTDADTLHGQLQERLKSAGLPEAVLTDTANYLTARLAFLEKTDPARFLTEGVAALSAVKEAPAPAALAVPISLPARLYGPLLKAGRLEDVQTAHTQLQTALTRLGNPNNGSATEVSAYYAALESAMPATFLAEVTTVVTATSTATKASELQMPLDLGRRAYPVLFAAGRVDEAKSLHGKLQASLTKVGASDLLQNDTINYTMTWWTYLEKNAPDQFLTEALATIAVTKTAQTAEDLRQPVDLGRRSYPLLLNRKRLSDAQTAHGQLQTALTKLGNPFNWGQADTTAYLAALESTDAAQFLTEARAVITAGQTTAIPSEALFLADLARRSYPVLLQTGATDEATAVQTQLQTLLTRVAGPDAAAADRLAYQTARFTALERTAPAQFLTDALALLATSAEGKTSGDIALRADLARRLYTPLVTAGRLEDAETVHDRTSAVLTATLAADDKVQADTDVYLATLERGAPGRFLDEVAAFLKVLTPASMPKVAPRAVDLARRAYPQYYAANRPEDARTLHEQFGKLLTAANLNDILQADTTTFQLARLAYLERARPSQFLTEALPFLTGETTVVTAATLPALVDLARRVYTPLFSSALSEDAKAVHTRLLALAAKLGLPAQAQADTAAYQVAWLSALEKNNPAQFLTEAQAIVDRVKTATGPADLNLPVTFAGRVYPIMLAAGQWEDASARHTQMQAAITQWGNPGNLAATELTAYINAMTDSITKLFQTAASSPELRTKARTIYIAAWSSDPSVMIDRVVPLVRDRLMRDASAGEWLTPYAILVGQVPPAHPTRPLALLVLGQFAQSQALATQVRGGDATALVTQAERAFRALVTDYPGSPYTAPAWTSLLALYQASNRAAEVDALLKGAANTTPLVDPYAWLANYYFYTGVAADVPKAADYYGRLLQLASDNAQAAIWQYRLACCLEKQGKAAEALAAYQKVLDGYPTSSAVVAAARKIDALKGGK
ncbi:MAG TPA: tetratricopeptide repeat protein [Armatimonadota bacterium]